MTFEHFLVNLLNRLQRSSTRRPRGRDLVLGTAVILNRRELVMLPEAARPMHLAIMGLTGVGKSYFLENLIRQDIDHGTGFVVFDVHGDLADNIVAYLAERATDNAELLDRVVLIEPFDPTHTIGFNPLERTTRTSAFLQAQELAHILRSRWETKSFGPRTEELLRATLYTLSAQNLTLLELPQLLIDEAFRRQLLEKLAEQAVVDYWQGRCEPLSDPMKAAVREPLLTRVSAFLADPQIREIVGQQKSTFSFHDAIRKSLWVVINLSKGRLGENSAVLGGLLFTKLELDVMAQAHTPPAERRLFTVYADELHNLAGPNFATLIAEARKYKIAITAGHQFWQQLSQDMRAAILGVGSRVFFRLHHRDALQLAGELDLAERQWYASFLTSLPPGHAVFRTGSDRPVEFRVETHPKPKSTQADIERLRARSQSLFATPRADVRKDIRLRYEQDAEPQINESFEESQTDL